MALVVDFCLSSVYKTHLCSHIKAVWGIKVYILWDICLVIWRGQWVPCSWETRLQISGVLGTVRHWKFAWLYLPSRLLTVGWLPTRGWTCDRGRIVMDRMPRLRNFDGGKLENHLLNWGILISRWKNAFKFLHLHFHNTWMRESCS